MTGWLLTLGSVAWLGYTLWAYSRWQDARNLVLRRRIAKTERYRQLFGGKPR